jgi:hypothetical protein
MDETSPLKRCDVLGHHPSSCECGPWLWADRNGELPKGRLPRSGKWMLFPGSDRVDAIWNSVDAGTQRGILGIQAKVATKSNRRPSYRGESTHLICVYTPDYQDKDDVCRVLVALEQTLDLDLDHRAIYYKPDAYTYAGIYSEGGKRASLYSSNDFRRDPKYAHLFKPRVNP